MSELATMLRRMFCHRCGKTTIHVGTEQGRQEVFRCNKCGVQTTYTVK